MLQRSAIIAVASIITLAVSAVPGAARQVVLPQDTMEVPTVSVAPEGPVPRTAFIRALAVPGWGHFSIGANRRGAVYMGLQVTSWAMLGKTIHGLNEARDAERGLAALSADSLARAMAADTALALRLQNPAAYDDALLTYPGLRDARGLATARQRHRQDWIVYTLVTTFAAAVDAYVAAHLSDFPAEITAVRTTDNGVSLGLRVPAGRSR
jgi:hypothetical protein